MNKLLLTLMTVWISTLIVLPPVFSQVAEDSVGPVTQWMTDREREQHVTTKFHEPGMDDPPAGPIISYPEWVPAEGVIISWMWFDDYLIDLTAAIVDTTRCYIVVQSYLEQLDVTSTLINHGVPTEDVYFLIFNLDTIWMVDYGPFFVSVNGNREIIDYYYFRPQDNLFPQRLGGEWSIPTYTSDLMIEGGNFIADGSGICFTTWILFENNPTWTEQQIRDELKSYCGCETVHVLDYLNDYTGHIDMFVRMIDVDTFIVGQYDPGDPEYQVLEDVADTISHLNSATGQPYEVIRIPMPGAPSEYKTYTNSLSVNNHILVPVYNLPEDTQALQIYQDAMPGYTVVGVDSTVPIEWGGAIHCTTKVIPVADAIPTQPPVTPTPSPTATPTSEPTPTAVPSSTPVMCIHDGDVDGNGQLTPADALLSFQIYLAIIPDPSYEEACAADCDGSESSTPADALCIFQNYLTGACACAERLN